MSLRTASLLCLALLRPLASLAAQDIPDRAPVDPLLVEALAPLLMLEDQRRFDSTSFANALKHQTTQVRHTAVMSLSRIGDRRGVALLLPLLQDRDVTVVADAFFALGMLGDTTALSPIMARLTLPDTISADAVGEAATALARIGGARAATLLGDGIAGRGGIPAGRLAAFRGRALQDAWRLGALAPTFALVPLANDRDVGLRYAAIYSLQRLLSQRMLKPVPGQLFLTAVRDKNPIIVEVAVRALTRTLADSGGVTREAVQAELIRAFSDAHAGVRINALQAAASWKDSTLAPKVALLLTDPSLNVQVQAAMTLGELGGSAAAKALDNAHLRKGASWGLRRATLLAMARTDSSLFVKRAGPWLKGTATNEKLIDAREKVVGLEGWAELKPADGSVFQLALGDPKPEVVAAALSAWQRVAPAEPLLLAAARQRLRHPSFMVRDAAIGVLDSVTTVDDLDGLLAAWQLGTADNSLDDRLSVIRAIASLAGRAPQLLTLLSDPGRVAFFARPPEMLLRREGNRLLPQIVGQRWGAAYPVDTGRSLDDYRGIVRTLVLATANPRVSIDLAAGGSVELELFAGEAPLTVANFLQLVDRRYFDLNTWHRVVPNFVVQTGDPTNSGNGGSDRPIRDEVGRRRYDNSVVGMANAGPDTGTSQWFINLSPQPHLDGRYTIFGRVSNFGRIGTTLETAFSRITQGDLIRTVRRVPVDN